MRQSEHGAQARIEWGAAEKATMGWGTSGPGSQEWALDWVLWRRLEGRVDWCPRLGQAKLSQSLSCGVQAMREAAGVCDVVSLDV